eukprot:1726985-Prymnesium_polylepis.2
MASRAHGGRGGTGQWPVAVFRLARGQGAPSSSLGRSPCECQLALASGLAATGARCQQETGKYSCHTLTQ